MLKVSPSLLEQYLAASTKIASLAVGDPSHHSGQPGLSASRRIWRRRITSKACRWARAAGILIHHNFPLDADYDFSVSLLQNIVGYVTGLEYPHQLEISIDGASVFLAPVGGEEDNKMSDANLGIAKDTLDARLKTRVHVGAGPACGGGRVSRARTHRNRTSLCSPSRAIWICRT